MGYLLPILIAFASLAYGDLGLPESGPRPWILPLFLPLPYLFGWLEERGIAGGGRRMSKAMRRLARVFPVALQYVAVACFGWLEAMASWFGESPGFEGWPRPELILALGPFLLASAVTIDAQARRTGPAWRSLRSFQARLFLTAMGPVVAYILIASAVGSVELLNLGIGRVSLWSFAFSSLIVLTFALGLPTFLRATWDTEPMAPGPQRSLLEQVAQLARFRCRELLVWHTGHLVANAAIVGLTPGSRRVFFTDELLARMSPRQLAAVYAHEIGHAKRNHVAIFLIWSLAVFAALDGGLLLADSFDLWVGYLALGLGLVIWLVGFGWLSRRIELEADLFSYELLQDTAGITSALHAVSGGNLQRGSWRHFSTARRIEFLQRVGANPLVGIQLHRMIRNVALVGLLFAVLGGGWRVVDFVQRYPVERACLDLGLGRYASAAERLKGLDGDEVEELARLASLAQAEGLEGLQALNETQAAVAELARKDLQGGQVERASAWLALAALSGDASAGAAGEWLVEWLAGAPKVREMPATVGTWAADLDAAVSRP